MPLFLSLLLSLPPQAAYALRAANPVEAAGVEEALRKSLSGPDQFGPPFMMEPVIRQAVAALRDRQTRESLTLPIIRDVFMEVMLRYDPDFTAEHMQGTGQSVPLMVRQLQKWGMYMDPPFVEALQLGAEVHDIGKVFVSLSILHKDGKLSPQEFREMTGHAELGALFFSRVIGQLDDVSPELGEQLQVVRDMIRFHHERWDGKGYPSGRRGYDIPLAARIMSVLDVFDARSQKRPYREGEPVDLILRKLQVDEGTHFQPGLVYAFAEAMGMAHLLKQPVARPMFFPSETPKAATPDPTRVFAHIANSLHTTAGIYSAAGAEEVGKPSWARRFAWGAVLGAAAVVPTTAPEAPLPAPLPAPLTVTVKPGPVVPVSVSPEPVVMLKLEAEGLDRAGSKPAPIFPDPLVAVVKQIKDRAVSISIPQRSGGFKSTGGGILYQVNEGSRTALVLTSPFSLAEYDDIGRFIQYATRPKIRLADGLEVQGSVVASDLKMGLALVRIGTDGTKLKSLPAPKEARSVRRGETIVTIGSPFEYEESVSGGIVSFPQRRLSGLSGDVVQISAPINPGHWGAPVFNSKEEWVGVVAGYYQGAQRIGFVIPPRTAQQFMVSSRQEAAPAPGIQASAEAEALGTSKPAPIFPDMVAEVVEQVKDRSVSITVPEKSGGYRLAGAGTLYHVDEKNRSALVLTVFHVLAESDAYGRLISSTTVPKVRLADGSEVQGRVVASDPSVDMALVRISMEGTKLKAMPPLKMAPAMLSGQTVVTIGAPKGLEQSVSTGVVSFPERGITSPSGANLRVSQVSAPLTPGNSGGGVFNLKGEWVGPVVAISGQDESEGVGFALLNGTVLQFIKSSGYAPEAVAAPEGPPAADIRRDTAAEVFKQVGESVVTILMPSQFGNRWKSAGAGTLVQMDEKNGTALVLTALHVVGKSDPKIRLADGSELKGTVVAFDHNVDLALVQIQTEGAKLKALPPPTKAPSLLIGQTVVAIGDPLGHERSVSSGEVSALHRQITMSTGATPEVFQITVPINGGNSGGPVFDPEGKLIGVVTALRRGSQGIGLVIPDHSFRRFLESYLQSVPPPGKAGAEESLEDLLTRLEERFGGLSDQIPQGIQDARRQLREVSGEPRLLLEAWPTIVIVKDRMRRLFRKDLEFHAEGFLPDDLEKLNRRIPEVLNYLKGWKDRQVIPGTSIYLQPQPHTIVSPEDVNFLGVVFERMKKEAPGHYEKVVADVRFIQLSPLKDHLGSVRMSSPGMTWLQWPYEPEEDEDIRQRFLMTTLAHEAAHHRFGRKWLERDLVASDPAERIAMAGVSPLTRDRDPHAYLREIDGSLQETDLLLLLAQRLRSRPVREWILVNQINGNLRKVGKTLEAVFDERELFTAEGLDFARQLRREFRRQYQIYMARSYNDLFAGSEETPEVFRESLKSLGKAASGTLDVSKALSRVEDVLEANFRYGDERLLPLIPVAEKVLLGDSHPQNRLAAAGLLGRTGRMEALNVFLKALDVSGSEQRETEMMVRRFIVGAIAELIPGQEQDMDRILAAVREVSSDSREYGEVSSYAARMSRILEAVFESTRQLWNQSLDSADRQEALSFLDQVLTPESLELIENVPDEEGKVAEFTRMLQSLSPLSQPAERDAPEWYTYEWILSEALKREQDWVQTIRLLRVLLLNDVSLRKPANRLYLRSIVEGLPDRFGGLSEPDRNAFQVSVGKALERLSAGVEEQGEQPAVRVGRTADLLKALVRVATDNLPENIPAGPLRVRITHLPRNADERVAFTDMNPAEIGNQAQLLKRIQELLKQLRIQPTERPQRPWALKGEFLMQADQPVIDITLVNGTPGSVKEMFGVETKVVEREEREADRQQQMWQMLGERVGSDFWAQDLVESVGELVDGEREIALQLLATGKAMGTVRQMPGRVLRANWTRASEPSAARSSITFPVYIEPGVMPVPAMSLLNNEEWTLRTWQTDAPFEAERMREFSAEAGQPPRAMLILSPETAERVAAQLPWNAPVIVIGASQKDLETLDSSQIRNYLLQLLDEAHASKVGWMRYYRVEGVYTLQNLSIAVLIDEQA